MSIRGTFTTLALSLVAALLATPVFLRVARRLGLLDRPNERSAHRRVTPRGGGLGAGRGGAGAGGDGARPRLPGGGRRPGRRGAHGPVGLLDDRVRLSVAPKLALQVAVAASVVWVAAGGLDRLPLPPPLDLRLGAWGGLVATLWLVGVVNFYNFLDGIDGLAVAQAVITGTGIALAGWAPMAAAAGAALAGACLGFLAFNWSPARVFLGDAGSALLGFAFAALPLLAAPSQRPAAVLFAAVSLWLFLADALFSIGRRAARGQDVLRAHREHVYQRLVESGLSHREVALGVAAGSAALTAVALLAWQAGRPAAQLGRAGGRAGGLRGGAGRAAAADGRRRAPEKGNGEAAYLERQAVAFFEGMQQKADSGLKEAEIPYGNVQMTLGLQPLGEGDRALVYPGRSISLGLADMKGPLCIKVAKQQQICRDRLLEEAMTTDFFISEGVQVPRIRHLEPTGLFSVKDFVEGESVTSLYMRFNALSLRAQKLVLQGLEGFLTRLLQLFKKRPECKVSISPNNDLRVE